MTDAQKEPGISVAQVFLEAATFAHRGDFLALPLTTKPEIGDLQVVIEAGLRRDKKAGVVRIKVSTQEERDPIYRVAVTMTALFEEQPGKANMPLDEFVHGPAIAFLYPFVREAFANLTARGRFGPVWLNPFNVQAASQTLRASYAESEPGPDRA